MHKHHKRKNNDFFTALAVLILFPAVTLSNYLELSKEDAGVVVVFGILIVCFYFLAKKNLQTSIKHNKKRSQHTKHQPSKPLHRESLQHSHSLAKHTLRPSEWTLELLRSLDWLHLENLCIDCFEATHEKIIVKKLNEGIGKDIYLYSDLKADQPIGIVRSRTWTTKTISANSLKGLLTEMQQHECSLGVFFAITGYSNEAKAFAEQNQIILLNSTKMMEQIKTLPSSLQNELLNKVTQDDYLVPSCPDCNEKLTLRKATRGYYQNDRFWACPNYPSCSYTRDKKPI